MSNKYSSPLDGVSFEDVILEANLVGSASPSAVPTRRNKENRNAQQSNHAFKFRIIKIFGKLSNRNNATIFAQVEWNGNILYDLRTWNEDYSVPYKGLTFNEHEIASLFSALSAYIPKQHRIPLCIKNIGKAKVNIYYVLSKLSSATINGIVWNKQVSIVDWGYGQKYDFRKWTDDYDKCSKGICLNQDEVDSLLSIMENLI